MPNTNETLNKIDEELQKMYKILDDVEDSKVEASKYNTFLKIINATGVDTSGMNAKQTLEVSTKTDGKALTEPDSITVIDLPVNPLKSLQPKDTIINNPK